MNRILKTAGIIAALAAVVFGIWAGERTFAMMETSSRIDQINKELHEGVPRYPGSDPESDKIMRMESIESNLKFYASIKSGRDLLALVALTMTVISAASFRVVRKRSVRDKEATLC